MIPPGCFSTLPLPAFAAGGGVAFFTRSFALLEQGIDGGFADFEGAALEELFLLELFGERLVPRGEGFVLGSWRPRVSRLPPSCAPWEFRR